MKKHSTFLLLNKIKHKPILFENIFNYVENRPFIFPYLIDIDPLLKKNLKEIMEPIDKNNKLSKYINDNICKYISIKLLYQIDVEILLTKIRTQFINENQNEKLRTFFKIRKIPSLIDYFSEIMIKIIKDKTIPSNTKISYDTIIANLPKNKRLYTFIIDYLSIQKEIILFYLPLKYVESIKDKYVEIIYTKNKIYKDSLYLYNINKQTKNKQKINLLCLLNVNKTYENPIEINYNFINKLYFVLDDTSKRKDKLFEKIYKYLIKIKNKENVEEIYFNNIFLYIYKDKEESKTYLEYMVEDYFNMKEKLGIIDLKLCSLKKIIFNDDNMNNNIARFKLRYNLMNIFNNKAWCKLIVIKHKDLENVFELNNNEEKHLYNKLNYFENDNTIYKIVYIDFEYNSPFQKNILYFFEKHLNNNKNINTIILDNIGNINYDKDYFQKIQKIQKIKIPNIIQIFYENNLIENKLKDNYKKYLINEKEDNHIKEFINSFFDFGNFFIYEGYNNKNQLVYYNITKRIDEDELERIFILNDKVNTLHLKIENMIMKYDRNENYINIINNNILGEDYIYNSNLETIMNFIYKFNEPDELNINFQI